MGLVKNRTTMEKKKKKRLKQKNKQQIFCKPNNYIVVIYNSF